MAEVEFSYGELLHQLLAFQLRVRRLTPATELSLSESQILGEIVGGKVKTAGQLSSRSFLEKSTVSRLLARLQTKRYLRFAERAKRDLRLKPVVPTALGKRTLEQDDYTRSLVSSKLLGALSEVEHGRFVAFFKHLADGFGIDQDCPRATEHALRCEQRRLSRAFGLLGGNFFQSRLSILEFHLLTILGGSPLRLTAATLESDLPYSPSSISRALQRLERQKSISRSAITADRRNLQVVITAAGREALGKVRKRVEQELGRACRVLEPAELQQGLDLLKRVVLSQDPLQPQLEITQAITLKDIFEARAFLVEQLVKSGRHQMLPAEILKAGTWVMQAKLRGHLVAVAGFNKSAAKLIVDALGYDAKQLSRQGARSFLVGCARQFGFEAVNIHFSHSNRGTLIQDPLRQGVI
jgi:DNA-binding MarR family transcriptional regulator